MIVGRLTDHGGRGVWSVVTVVGEWTSQSRGQVQRPGRHMEIIPFGR